MTDSQFADLCRDLSLEFGAADVEALAAGEAVHIDGIAMALDIDDEEAPGRLKCFVDLGEIDDEHRLAILEEAMVVNISLEGSEHGVIGLHQDTNRLVLARTLRCQDGAAMRAVAQALRRLATFSKNFQANLRNIAAPEGLAGVHGHEIFA